MKPSSMVILAALPAGFLGPACASGSPLVAAVPPAATSDVQACRPGVTTIAGGSYRVFCGPATASVKSGGKVLSFAGGQCSRTSSYFTINIGAAVLGQVAKPAKPYFGLTVGKLPGGAVMGGRAAGSDGTYKGVDAAFNSGGVRFLALDATVTLSGRRSRGSFSGNLLTGGRVSGTFHC